MYDVIVAGAGPAGCTAAKMLAEKGCKVLLAERFKMPRYKSCEDLFRGDRAGICHVCSGSEQGNDIYK